MKQKEIIALMSAYGFVLDREDMQQRLTRFKKDEGGGFIDVWQGRKGMTIGAYDVKTARMNFVRNGNAKKLEDVLARY